MSNVVWNLGTDFAGGGQHFAHSVLYKLFEKALISNPSATSFLMKDGLNIAIFHGSFVLNGNVIQSGTITGFDVYYDTPSSHLVAASGYAIDANAFKQAAAAWKAHNVEHTIVPSGLRRADDGEWLAVVPRPDSRRLCRRPPPRLRRRRPNLRYRRRRLHIRRRWQRHHRWRPRIGHRRLFREGQLGERHAQRSDGYRRQDRRLR